MTGFVHTNSRGIRYFLRETTVTLRGGQPQSIKFFTPASDDDKGHPIDLPSDLEVKENPRNGFLTVSRKRDFASPELSHLAEDWSTLSIGENLEEVSRDLGVVQDPFGERFTLAALRDAYATPYSLQIAYLAEIVATRGIRESEFQKFLEENPELIPGDHFEVMAQVVLEISPGRTYRPDFMLRPVNDLWDLLELKRPDVPLITKYGNHVRLTHHMTSAISQLRDYADALAVPEVNGRLYERYGIRTLKPRLRLIIGRTGDDRESVQRVIRRDAIGVKVFTWNDVVEINRRKAWHSRG